MSQGDTHYPTISAEKKIKWMVVLISGEAWVCHLGLDKCFDTLKVDKFPTQNGMSNESAFTCWIQ